MLNFRETPEKKTQTKDTDRLGGRTTFGLSRLVSRAIEEEIKQVCLTKNAQKVFCQSALKYAASSEEEEDMCLLLDLCSSFLAKRNFNLRLSEKIEINCHRTSSFLLYVVCKVHLNVLLIKQYRISVQMCGKEVNVL